MTIAEGGLVTAGVLVAASGILGVLGRLPRNRWAGVRTSATLRNDPAFEAGNRVAGPAVIAAASPAWPAVCWRWRCRTAPR
jgi:hypothetical protein